MRFPFFLLALFLPILSWGEVPKGPEHWERFDPEPLHIISPEQPAISNPPFMHWQELPNAESYRIDLVGGEGSHEWSSPWNFFTPAHAIPNGVYTLKVSALDGAGNVLGVSDAYEFLLDRDPDGMDADFSSLNLVPGAPIAYTEEMIRDIRNATGLKAPHRDHLVALAREPREGALENPVEPERYPEGVFVHAYWSRNNSLAFQMEDYIARQLLAWSLTGETVFAENAREMILLITEWDPVGATGVWENDHSAHSMMRSLALGYNLLGEELAGEDRDRVREAIIVRAEDLYRFLNPFVTKLTSAGPMNDPDNNHAWFCTTALALGALAIVGEEPRAEKWVSYSGQLYRGMFLPRGDAKGGWHEGNDYWSYMLFFVFQFADAIHLATGIDFYQHSWLRNTGEFKVYVHPPVGAYVPFGNCKHYAPTAFDKMVMMRLASWFDDPLLWRYVHDIDAEITHTRDRYFSLMWGTDQMPEDFPPTDFPFAIKYEDMGWIVSNTDPFNVESQSIFAFRAGPFLGRGFGHIHADQNHFVLAVGGDKLLWDAGYYDGYLTPHNRDFARLSDAHNTILVDGVGQLVQIAGLDAEITRFVATDSSLTVTGDASTPLLYDGRVERFIRTVDYDQAGARLHVEDDIELVDEGEISFLLHSAHPFVYHADGHRIKVLGDSYILEGTFHSDEPFTVTIRDHFPVEPNRPRGREHLWPEQYHLEIRTSNAVKTWQPRFEATWARRD